MGRASGQTFVKGEIFEPSCREGLVVGNTGGKEMEEEEEGVHSEWKGGACGSSSLSTFSFSCSMSVFCMVSICAGIYAGAASVFVPSKRGFLCITNIPGTLPEWGGPRGSGDKVKKPWDTYS
jgi:hypothetical protein